MVETIILPSHPDPEAVEWCACVCVCVCVSLAVLQTCHRPHAESPAFVLNAKTGRKSLVIMYNPVKEKQTIFCWQSRHNQVLYTSSLHVYMCEGFCTMTHARFGAF